MSSSKYPTPPPKGQSKSGGGSASRVKFREKHPQKKPSQSEPGRGWRNYVERKTGIPLTSEGLSAFRGGAAKGVRNIDSWGADPGRLVRGVGGAISTIPATGAAFLSEHVGRPVERAILGDDKYSRGQSGYWRDTRDAAGAAARDAWTPGGGSAMQQYENIDKQPELYRGANQSAKDFLATGSIAATGAPLVATGQALKPLAAGVESGIARVASGGAAKLAPALVPAAEGVRRVGQRMVESPAGRQAINSLSRVGDAGQKVGDKVSQLQTSRAAMPIQQGVHQLGTVASKIENNPVSQTLGLGPKGNVFSIRGGASKFPGAKIAGAGLSAAEKHNLLPSLTNAEVKLAESITGGTRPTAEQVLTAGSGAPLALLDALTAEKAHASDMGGYPTGPKF